MLQRKFYHKIYVFKMTDASIDSFAEVQEVWDEKKVENRRIQADSCKSMEL